MANFLKAGRREHAAEAHFLAAQVMRVLQQRADRLAAGAEDRFIANFGMSAQQWPQFLGNGKGDDEMLHREQLAGLPG